MDERICKESIGSPLQGGHVAPLQRSTRHNHRQISLASEEQFGDIGEIVFFVFVLQNFTNKIVKEVS